MNILLVSDVSLPFIAGVSTSTDSIARFMISQGHTVTQVSPKPIIPGEIPPLKGLTVVFTPSVPDIAYGGKSMTLFPLGLAPISKTLSSGTFDIVHVQEPGSLGVCGLFEAKRRHIPVVGALHFTPDQSARMIPGKPDWPVIPLLKAYIKYIYDKYDAIMVPTQTFVDFLNSLHVKTPKTVVSNGVDTNKFTPAPLDLKIRESLGIPGDSFVFFFLGRLDKDKNVQTLVEALPYADKKVRLLIAGKGKEEAMLKERATALGVSDRITWIGAVSEPEMIGLYHTVNAFSIMSPYEVQSIVTLQAIASGLPILAARAGALPELCRENENGLLADTYDYKMAAEKMNALASNPKLCEQFGKRSREISLVHHKQTVLKRLEDLYVNVIAEKKKL